MKRQKDKLKKNSFHLALFTYRESSYCDSFSCRNRTADSIFLIKVNSVCIQAYPLTRLSIDARAHTRLSIFVYMYMMHSQYGHF